MKANIKILIVLLLFFPFLLFSQDGTFTASVDRTTIEAQEQFEFTLTLSGSDVNAVRNLKPPDFSQFVIMGGPNQSTNMQWINGKVSATVTYTYVLYARTAGKYTISSASIEYKGNTLKTQPIPIQVIQTKAQKPQAQQPQQAQQGTVNIGDNVLLRAFVNKNKVRVGEQITVTYKLYTRVQLYDYYIPKLPAYEGFWAEELEQSQKPAFVNEVFEGKQYYGAVIRKVALFPRQSGSLKIAPLEFRTKVMVQQQRRRNDPFDMFFNDPFLNQGQLVEQDLKSNIASITVDPLPLSPQGFSGAVGKYNFSASVDKREVKAGDPITLRFVVSGQGNMSLVTIPTPTLPADFESYEPKLSADVNKNGGVLSGKKAADYLLIPRNAGQRTIEPTQFIFFNLEKNSYVSLKSPRFEITVKPGKEPSASSPMIAKEDVRLLGQDIRFLKLKSGGFRPVDEIPFSGEYNIILIILAPLAFIGAFAYRWRMDTLAGNISSVKFRKAAREASKRLKLARKLLEQGNTEQYHTEISRALLGYLEDKLHLPKASLTLDTAAEQMKLKSVNQQVVQNLVSCIERAEFARFAPGADSREGRKDLLDASISAIETVEKEMMGKNKS